MIHCDCEFVLKNLETMEEKRYYLEESVQGDVKYNMGENGIVIPGSVKISGLKKTETDADIITSSSPLGQCVLGRNVGDVFMYVVKKKNGITKNTYKVLDITSFRKDVNDNYVKLSKWYSVRGIMDIFNSYKREGKLLIIQRDFWTDDYTFVVEKVDGIYLYGSTFKGGKRYNSLRINSLLSGSLNGK